MAVLLVLSLLVCHGVLGAMHQVSWSPTPDAGLHTHAASQEGHGAGEPPDGHEPYPYAAALAVALAAIAIALLRRRATARGTRVLREEVRRARLVSLLPRGPTPEALQVFRL